MRHRKNILGCVLILAISLALAAPASSQPRAIPLDGLRDEAKIVWDGHGIPHIFTRNDTDLAFMMGYVHAQDRFFQMDSSRRLFSGTLAEILGGPALPTDVQLRTLGLRRGAEETWAAASRATKIWLEAYAAGVNAYLANNPLPPEYTFLEISRRGVPRWTPVDSLAIGKGLAFGLSFDLDDIDRTISLGVFQQAGAVGGFDGTALFFEDLFRSAPFDPTVSIPAAPGASVGASRSDGNTLEAARRLSQVIQPKTLELALRYREQLDQIPALSFALSRNDVDRGSNWWIVSGDHTVSGRPLLANDPHLALNSPATFYETHLLVFDPDRPRVLNANGVSFPGAPALAQGCNTALCWGSTVNPMDVTDVYQEVVFLDPQSGLPTATLFDGQLEPLVLIPQTFLVNQIGDGIPDTLADAGLGPLNGGLTLVVPRRNNGPIVALDASDPTAVVALSVQYTGWRATSELEAFRRWLRAKSIREFRQDLQFFDVGSQNWSVIDTSGNIAYFTSAEMPLREDLQNLNAPDGLPPFLIRDGTHTLQNEWLPVQNPQPQQALAYEVLPFEEMPQVVNPASGYVINANNDPIGTTLDNNPLNQLRPGGGIYYLSPGYASLRAGRIARLFDEALADGGKVTPEDMMAIQGNNQLLDAELVTPFLIQAFQNASAPGAPDSLAALAGDPRLAEATGRLQNWDFSTPTGLAEGYDPGDDPAALAAPSQAEIDASVAATLYSVWRGQMIGNTVDAVLEATGLGDFGPGSVLAWSAVVHQLQDFPALQGVGASGLPFFLPLPDSADPAAARDGAILQSLADALDLLASDTFGDAFGGSTNQADYRWGALHRIVLDHPLGSPFSIPQGGGLTDLSPDLPGIARSGGFQAVDASSHSARAAGVNSFMFGAGPNRRFVGEMDRGNIDAYQVIPGGQSALPGSPHQADQLQLWLTNRYHRLLLRTGEVRDNSQRRQRFRPAS